MTSPTLGFSLSPADQDRVARLADGFAHGNRSEWLRQATDLFEQWAVFQVLARTQARGAQLTAHHRISPDDIPDLVARAAAAPSGDDWLATLAAELVAGDPHVAETDGSALDGFLADQ